MTPNRMWFSWNCPGLHYTMMTSSVIDNLKIWKPYSICHMVRSRCLWRIFSSPLLIIVIPYARSGSLTLLNMCQTLFMRVKLFKRPIYKQRKSSSVLTHTYNPARRGTRSWVLGQVWLAVGSIWTLICNSRLNPRVHLSETSGGQAAILISPVSPRGGEGRGGTRWRH